MNFQIILTANFLRELKPLEKKYKSIVGDLIALQNSLSSTPIQGTALGHDCFKIRMAIKSKGKGKSGGARVIACIKIIKRQIFLLDIFDKSEKENITNQRLIYMLREAGLDKL
jgi:hypothetical protein